VTDMILAHVSDIHFRQYAGGATWDVNVPLRVALERDLASLADQLGHFRGIVATGDIGFSGKSSEYDQATEWLADLTNIAGCAAEDVWVVPGNHDVDRDKVDSSDLIREFHRTMRQNPRDSIGDLLRRHLTDDEAAGGVYMSPLAAYVAFATPYGCDIDSQRPWWDCRIPFENASPGLRLRGLTSVLISDRLDDQDGNRPILGPAQVAMAPLPMTITMTLSHHPPSWLRDQDAVEEALRPVAEIQLWGHRHRQATRPIDGNVHLFAGAVHPARGEMDWEPRYNVLRLSMPNGDGTSNVDVFPRVWRRDSGHFGPDLNSLEGDIFRRHVVTLHSRIAEALQAPAAPRPADAEVEDMETPMTPSGDPRRRLAFRFGTLPYQRRLAIARDLGLVSEDARGLSDRNLFEIVLAEAVAMGRLADLWEAIDAAHGQASGPNPFSG
jgi:hypothetical protein